MPGLGTVINCIGVIGGGLLGLIVKKGLSERFQNILIQAVGLSVIFLGIIGTAEQMLIIRDGRLQSQGTMMVIASLACGALLGELINIEKHTEEFGGWIKKKTGSSGDVRFVEGFVNTSLTICIGAMAVVGAIQDGISGDISMLCAKAVLDAIIVFVMASSLGKGCIFSVIPLGLFQGTVTLLARVVEPLLTAPAVSNLSAVGSMMIFCVGVNLMFHQKIKVANLLPALLFAVICAFLPWF